MNLPLFEDARLAHLLDMTGFPETAEDAANILALARASRDERKCHKVAARLAIQQVMILLQVVRRKGGDEQRQQGDLPKLHSDLANASRSLSDAHHDIGLVSSIVRRKGFALEYGPEYHGHAPDTPVDDDVGLDTASVVPSNFGADEDSELSHVSD